MERQPIIDSQSQERIVAIVSAGQTEIQPPPANCKKGQSADCKVKGCPYDAFFKSTGDGMGGNTTCIAESSSK